MNISNANISFRGNVYPSGEDPEIKTPQNKVIGFSEDQAIKVRQAISNNKTLIDQISPTKIDVVLTNNQALIKYRDDDGTKRTVDFKKKIPLETVNHFVKRALNYVVKNLENLKKLEWPRE